MENGAVRLVSALHGSHWTNRFVVLHCQLVWLRKLLPRPHGQRLLGRQRLSWEMDMSSVGICLLAKKGTFSWDLSFEDPIK